MLASESLRTLSRDFVLEISDLDILSAFTEGLVTDPAEMQALYRCIREKNLHGLTEVLNQGDADPARALKLKQLLKLYGTPESVLPALQALCRGNAAAEAACQALSDAVSVFRGTAAEEAVQIDFSAAADMNYYNGVVFSGYIDGVPESVLSGGQYDVLMRKMNRRSGAIGFAVYLDLLERITLPED